MSTIEYVDMCLTIDQYNLMLDSLDDSINDALNFRYDQNTNDEAAAEIDDYVKKLEKLVKDIRMCR